MKLILRSPNELWLIFENRSPVIITGDDALALYTWMQTPTKLTVTEFRRAVASSLEDTQVAAA